MKHADVFHQQSDSGCNATHVWALGKPARDLCVDSAAQ